MKRILKATGVTFAVVVLLYGLLALVAPEAAAKVRGVTPAQLVGLARTFTATQTFAADSLAIALQGTLPSLNFDDTSSAAESSDGTIQVNCTDAGAGTEDCDMIFWSQAASIATTYMAFDADGAADGSPSLDVAVSLNAIGEMVTEGASPVQSYLDTNVTDKDTAVTTAADCTDTASGTEDCDYTIWQKIAGVLTEVMDFDADGVIETKVSPLLPTGGFHMDNASAVRYAYSIAANGDLILTEQ